AFYFRLQSDINQQSVGEINNTKYLYHNWTEIFYNNLWHGVSLFCLFGVLDCSYISHHIFFEQPQQITLFANRHTIHYRLLSRDCHTKSG
ncbi:hypothetical protein ACJX0J_024444, partial [Zea mays]